MTVEELDVQDLAFDLEKYSSSQKSNSTISHAYNNNNIINNNNPQYSSHSSSNPSSKSVPILINGTVKYLPPNFFEPVNKPISKLSVQPNYSAVDDNDINNRSGLDEIEKKKLHNPHHSHHGPFEIWQLVAMVALFAIVLSSMVWLIRFDSSKCTMDEQTLDQCARRLFFFSSEVKRFPSTNHQLDLYCSDKGQSIKCLRRYVNTCLEVNKAQWRYFKMFVKNYQKQLDNTCLRVNDREKFITYSNCLSNTELIQNATTCIDAHQDQLVYIAQMVPEESRVAATCCSLHLRNRCLTENISNRCQGEVERFVMEQIEGPFRSLVSSICSPYFMSLKDCRKRVKPHLWNEVYERPEFIKNFRESRQLLGTGNSTEILDENFHLDPNVENQDEESGFEDENNNNRSMNIGQNRTSPQFIALSNDKHQNPQQLQTKLVQLKFQESFLAMVFILRNKS